MFAINGVLVFYMYSQVIVLFFQRTDNTCAYKVVFTPRVTAATLLFYVDIDLISCRRRTSRNWCVWESEEWTKSRQSCGEDRATWLVDWPSFFTHDRYEPSFQILPKRAKFLTGSVPPRNTPSGFIRSCLVKPQSPFPKELLGNGKPNSSYLMLLIGRVSYTVICMYSRLQILWLQRRILTVVSLQITAYAYTESAPQTATIVNQTYVSLSCIFSSGVA